MSAAWQAGHNDCTVFMKMKDSAEESVADVEIFCEPSISKTSFDML